MPARGKDLTNEEREWLREWGYEYEHDRTRGLEALGRAIGYASGTQVSRVLNDEHGGHGFRTAAWKALLGLLLDDEVAAELFEMQAASAESRREMRQLKQKRALLSAIEAERPAGVGERGTVELAA